MGYGRYEYYRECVEIAASECGATLTKEQLDYIGASVEGSVENVGMAFPCPDRPDTEGDLRRELAREQSKVVCGECKGRGWITEHGPSHSATSQCHICYGAGKVIP